ncbi:MAG: 50S ribosomal protein L23 [Patescibacteria group bacterium]
MAFNLFNKSKKEPKAPKQEPQVQDEVLTGPSVSAPAGTILKRYFVSEKSTRGFAANQYTFEVDRRATKTDVRDAVERGYKVDVISVNTIRLPAKKIMLGRHAGTKGGIKKAIVTLKEGQTIAQAQP